MTTRYILAILTILLLFSCQQKRKAPNTASGEYTLIDDGPPLAEINKIFPIGSDSMLVVDNKFQLQLFVNNRFEKVLGKKGKGPGEYSYLFHCVTNGDTLFIFDRHLGKIIMSSIKTDVVYKELTNKRLLDFFGMIRTNGACYFTFSKYKKNTEPDKCLLYVLDNNNQIKSLNFHYADLGPEKVMFPWTLSVRVLMQAKDDKIYIVFPFSPRIYIYDIVYDKVTSFILDLKYPRDRNFAELTDLKEVMKMAEQIELPTEIFLLDRYIALWCVVPKLGKAATLENSRICLYSYVGTELDKFNVYPSIYNIGDTSFSRWEVDTVNYTTQYPYKILNEKYKIKN